MRLAVIGAGAVGVATAYELTELGHQVTVFDRHATAAEGASFANAGLIAPEWVAMQAAVRWQAEQSVGLGSLWQKITTRKKTRHGNPAPALLALTRYSSEVLTSIATRHSLTTDSHQGLMVVCRSERETERAAHWQTRVRDMGGECAALDATQARQLEPALSVTTALHSALVLPGAWSTNCRQFTSQLRALAQENGCRFVFGTEIAHMVAGSGGVRLEGLGLSAEDGGFDAVVLCTGAAGVDLLRSGGVRLPLEAQVGYSISAPVREALDAPQAVVLDPRRKVVVARMGQRVRVSGLSANGSAHPSPAEVAKLYAALDDWFPGAIRLGGGGTVQEWHGQVTTTPDGLPLVGESGLPGVWLNMAHGMHGWGMACGSARALAARMSGAESDIDLHAFRPGRWA
jgi:D-amino-acid dehydrogenase